MNTITSNWLKLSASGQFHQILSEIISDFCFHTKISSVSFCDYFSRFYWPFRFKPEIRILEFTVMRQVNKEQFYVKLSQFYHYREKWITSVCPSFLFAIFSVHHQIKLEKIYENSKFTCNSKFCQSSSILIRKKGLNIWWKTCWKMSQD